LGTVPTFGLDSGVVLEKSTTGTAVASGTTTESRSSETPPGLEERAKAEPARLSTTIEVKMMHSSFDG